MSGTKVRRGQWDDLYLLPWERADNEPRSFPTNAETVSKDDYVLLWLPDGTPLGKPRRRFGFRPEDAR